MGQQFMTIFKIFIVFQLVWWAWLAEAQIGQVSYDRDFLDDPRSLYLRLRTDLRTLDQAKDKDRWLTTACAWLWIKEVSHTDELAEEAEVLEKVLVLTRTHSDLTQRFSGERLRLYALEEELSLKERLKAYDLVLSNPELDRIPILKAQILFDRSKLLDNDGQSTLALQGYHEVLDLLKNKAATSLYLNLWTKDAIASLLSVAGNEDKIAKIDEQLTRFCEERPLRHFCLNQYYSLANNILNQDELKVLPQAEPFLRKTEQYANSLGDPDSLGTLAYARLKYHKALGQTEAALTWGKKAFTAFASIQRKDFMVFSLRRMAEVLKDHGRSEEGLAHVQKALEIMGDQDFQGNAKVLHRLAADFHRSLKQPEAALQAYDLYVKDIEKESQEKEKAAYASASASIGLSLEEEKSIALQQSLESQQRIHFLFFCVLGLGTIALGFAIHSYRQSRVMFDIQKELRTLFDEIQLGIITFDDDLKISSIYSGFMHTLFEGFDSFAKQDFFELIGSKSSEALDIATLRTQLKSGFGKPQGEWNALLGSFIPRLQIQHSLGDKQLVLTWKGLIDRHGKVQRVLLTLRDMTEEALLKEAVDIQNERLIGLGTLTATIAHDIASPSYVIAQNEEDLQKVLTDLRSVLEEIFVQADDDDAKAVWASIAGQLNQVADFTQAIDTAIARIIRVQKAVRNQARQADEIETFTLFDLIEESITLANTRVRRSRLEMICDPSLKMWGLRSQLGQVLTNLLNNAGDALEEAGEPVECRLVDIRITVKVLEKDLFIRIEDAGTGIPPEVRRRLFQAFFTTKKVGKGTGLGLPICKKIIEKHAGSLSLEDDGTLSGACFQIRIPNKSLEMTA